MLKWLRKLLRFRNHDSFQKTETENHGETEKRIRAEENPKAMTSDTPPIPHSTTWPRNPTFSEVIDLSPENLSRPTRQRRLPNPELPSKQLHSRPLSEMSLGKRGMHRSKASTAHQNRLWNPKAKPEDPEDD